MKPATADSIKNDLDLAMALLIIGFQRVCDSRNTKEAIIMRSVRSVLCDLYEYVEKLKEKGEKQT